MTIHLLLSQNYDFTVITNLRGHGKITEKL